MANNRDIDIRVKGTDDGASKTVDDVNQKLDDLSDKADEASAETDKLGESLVTTADKGEQLKSTFEGMRNIGAVITGIGAASLALTKGFTDAAIEADTLGAKLQGMLASVNLTSAIGQIQDLGAELANTIGGDDDEIAAAIGEAVTSGRVMRLRQYGIVVDKLGQQAITAAQGISAQAGAQEALDQIVKASSTSIATMKDEIGDAAIAAHSLENRWGNVQETMGEGTSVVQVALYKYVLSPLLDIAEAHEGVVQTAGAVWSIGASGISAVGGVVTLAGQVGLLVLTFPSLAASATTAFGVVRTAAATTIPFLAGVARALAVPFAILVAGAAAGIAAYEALRALNIGGFGDTHKSTGEIIADTRKKLLGDPAAEAEKATKAAADAAAKATPSIPTPPLPAIPTPPATPPINAAAAAVTAMPVERGTGPGWIDTSKPSGTPATPGLGGSNKITLRPKTRVSQNSGGDYVVEILPEKFVIPNNLQTAVEGL